MGRILHRHGVPRLADCDPLTGVPIRAARTTANRYERARPGELIHLDVKKLGGIPDGAGRRAHGRSEQVKDRAPVADHDGQGGWHKTTRAEFLSVHDRRHATLEELQVVGGPCPIGHQ